MNNGTNRLTFMHKIKGFVNVIQAHGVGNEIVECKLAVHVALYDTRQLGAAFNATECVLRHASGL